MSSLPGYDAQPLFRLPTVSPAADNRTHGPYSRNLLTAGFSFLSARTPRIADAVKLWRRDDAYNRPVAGAGQASSVVPIGSAAACRQRFMDGGKRTCVASPAA